MDVRKAAWTVKYRKVANEQIMKCLMAIENKVMRIDDDNRAKE